MGRTIDARTAIRQVENWLQVAGKILMDDPTKSVSQKIETLREIQAIIDQGFRELIGRLVADQN